MAPCGENRYDGDVPVWLGAFVGVLLGAGVSWWIRAGEPPPDPLGDPRERPWLDPLIARWLLFGGLVWAPVCAYPILFHADWAYAYVVDSRAVPSALELVLMISDAAAPAAGAWAVGRKSLRFWSIAVPTACVALVLIVLGPRWLTYGTWNEVRARLGAVPVWRSPIALGSVWMTALTGIALVRLVRSARIDGRPPLRKALPDVTRETRRGRLLGQRGRPS